VIHPILLSTTASIFGEGDFISMSFLFLY